MAELIGTFEPVAAEHMNALNDNHSLNLSPLMNPVGNPWVLQVVIV